MQQKLEIEWFAEDENGNVKEAHEQALKDAALERISSLMNEGYHAGEIIETIRMDDSDGDDGVSYHGWFNIKRYTETKNGPLRELVMTPSFG